jgi:hypothetical protein
MQRYAAPVASVLAVTAIAWVVKLATKRKVKKPNGKKGGIISLQVVAAFAVLTCIGIVTRDPFAVVASAVLALLLVKTKYDAKHFHQNQLIGSAAMGVVLTMLGWWFIDGKLNPAAPLDRPDLFAPKPEMDQRREADGHAEYKLDSPGGSQHSGGGGSNSVYQPHHSPPPEHSNDSQVHF